MWNDEMPVMRWSEMNDIALGYYGPSDDTSEGQASASCNPGSWWCQWLDVMSSGCQWLRKFDIFGL